MIKKILLLISLACLICCAAEEPQRLKLFDVFEQLGICINLTEKEWLEKTELDASLKDKWRYFCDSSLFIIHKLGPMIPIEDELLLEIRVGHGTEEYDNFVIKRTDAGYKVVCEFKGYIDTVFLNNTPYYQFQFQFHTAQDHPIHIIGSYNGKSFITDTVIDFIKQGWEEKTKQGTSWCE